MTRVLNILALLVLAGCKTDLLPCPIDCGANDAPSSKKVLIIGLDGCRTDAFLHANTPVLDSLISNGHLYAEVNRGPHTVSAPGWAALLTGVWSNKHGVTSNSYSDANFETFPDLFERLKQKYPCKRMYFVNSHPIVSKGMFSAADYGEVTGDDAEASSRAGELLRMCLPDIMFIHLNDIDHQGHDTGFDPQSQRYLSEIEDCDRQIGSILSAFKSAFPEQEQLVFIATDHGGEGSGHSNEDNNPNVTHVFMIGSSNGPLAWKDTFAEQVDLYPSVLRFLDMTIDTSWALDGKPLLQ